MIQWFCYIFLKIQGWKFVDRAPKDLTSFVCIGAPHTSNYDFFPAMATLHKIKRNPKFVIKNEWMVFPFNLFFKLAGAVGVNRKSSSSATDAIAELFQQHQELVLLISPEGTRSPRDTWKSGFYYIAQKAKVPIGLGYVDYAKKETGVGMIIHLTNYEDDMKIITNFYKNMTAKNADNFKLDKKYH